MGFSKKQWILVPTETLEDKPIPSLRLRTSAFFKSSNAAVKLPGVSLVSSNSSSWLGVPNGFFGDTSTGYVPKIFQKMILWRIRMMFLYVQTHVFFLLAFRGCAIWAPKKSTKKSAPLPRHCTLQLLQETTSVAREVVAPANSTRKCRVDVKDPTQPLCYSNKLWWYPQQQ